MVVTIKTKIKLLISVVASLVAVMIFQVITFAEITSKNLFRIHDAGKILYPADHLPGTGDVPHVLPGGGVIPQKPPGVGPSLLTEEPATWITKIEDFVVWVTSFGGHFSISGAGNSQTTITNLGLWWIFWFTFIGIVIVFLLLFGLILLLKRHKRKEAEDEQVA